MSDIASQLATSDRAYVIAAAGCGKTEEIAKAVAKSTDGRQLVLTHTHAGVNSLRLRLKKLGVHSDLYRIVTIAGLALRWSSAYPALSGLANDQPASDEEWIKVYNAGTEVFQSAAVRKSLQASFAGVYVDEYQDCIIQQHRLIMSLAAILPCRILGDPLQGIFDFRGQQLVDWERDIAPNFEQLPDLKIPWRWNNANRELGDWLSWFRSELRAGQAIDLRRGPVNWRQFGTDRNEDQRTACWGIARNRSGSIVAIHQWPNECHKAARSLVEQYTSIEEIYSKDLMKHAEEIENSQGNKRAVAVIDFASTCRTKVSTELKRIKERLASKDSPDLDRFRKYPQVIEALLEVVRVETLSPVLTALEAIEIEGIGRPHRRELWNEMKRTLCVYQSGDFDTLRDAAWYIRQQTSILGRRAERRIISRTMLVKGLEFDHAIVLNADALNMKNLYVAMTRGARSLTVLSQSPYIQKTA